MLHRIQRQDFSLVVGLLDCYVEEKETNHLLWAWKRIKECNSKTNRYFSHSSFSKPSSHARKLSKAEPHQTYRRRQLAYCLTAGNEPVSERETISFKNTFPISEKQEADDDFEDVVLQKIRAIQQRLNQVKSHASSSINESRSSTRRFRTDLSQSGAGIRFELNPRYIPMRQRLNGVESFILQSQNYEVGSNSEQEIEDGMETPRIGCRSKNQTINYKTVKNDEIIREELNTSTLSAGQGNYETKDSRMKNYYQLLESTGNNSLLKEVSSQLNSQRSSRVAMQVPLATISGKNAQENKKTFKDEQLVGYHPDVGYFRMVPIPESEVNGSMGFQNAKTTTQFPKRANIKRF